jgi:C4-type Zn-finger protein
MHQINILHFEKTLNEKAVRSRRPSIRIPQLEVQINPAKSMNTVAGNGIQDENRDQVLSEPS